MLDFEVRERSLELSSTIDDFNTWEGLDFEFR